MDPKTGEIAETPKPVFDGPFTPKPEDVKRTPQFLAREQMAKKAQALRLEEADTFKPDVLTESGEIVSAEAAPPSDIPSIEEEPAAADPQTEEPQQEAAPEPEPEAEEEMTLIVDGKEQKVPVSKIIDAGKRTLQKEAAADQRLASATELERQLRERLAAMEPPKGAPEREIVQQPVAQPSEEDAELAHAIQFGTEEQARNAIAKLRSSGRGMDGQDLTHFVQKTLQAAVPDQIAFFTANNAVRNDYKEIFSDPDLEQLFMLQETRARKSGDRRPYSELYKDIAEGISSKFGLRKAETQASKSTPLSERVVKKAAAPRPAPSISAEVKAQEGPKRPLTVSEYVQQQRQRRGLQSIPKGN